ncbi:hypothetical protein BOTBODRAFT_431098 [Botryobasidium botryosum FD-172 SS1]|uniref:Ubiquitin-like protease family profile domain-containing protein n=1 Tax=Botryobasidium botryosum (strain FD-172 SS1) TaxID=930990 RepID=A0A067MB13_BOTB1|nr:hypothetical protein BOTBODRAFT_431098 [Botryobasidium botryosum FD-172 SS1]
MHECFKQEIEFDKWEWVDEQRPTRQSNTYDCGPFTCADIVSLAETGSPSTMTQDDMGQWRAIILEELRGLEPRVIGKRARVSDLPPDDHEVIVID